MENIQILLHFNKQIKKDINLKINNLIKKIYAKIHVLTLNYTTKMYLTNIINVHKAKQQ